MLVQIMCVVSLLLVGEIRILFPSKFISGDSRSKDMCNLHALPALKQECQMGTGLIVLKYVHVYCVCIYIYICILEICASIGICVYV